MYLSDFTRNLWKIRRDKGMTQAELARLAGCSVRTIYTAERGKHKNPPPEMIARLAEVLGVTIRTHEPQPNTENLMPDFSEDAQAGDMLLTDEISLDELLGEQLEAPYSPIPESFYLGFESEVDYLRSFLK